MSRAPRTRPELPRLVEQLRILLWLQMNVTLIWLLAMLVVAGLDPYHNLRSVESSFTDWYVAAMLSLVVVAVLLSVCARLLWRRWAWVYPLVVLVELVIVADGVLGFATGLALDAFVVVSLLLTLWIVVDLCRREVRAHLFRLDAPHPVSPDTGRTAAV